MSEFTLDDRDPSVEYSGHWSNIGNSGDNVNMNTLKLTRVQGARAIVRFEGTAITVLGHLSPRGTGDTPESSYILDGATVGSYTGAPHSSRATNAEFFRSRTLEPGPHTLVIVNDAEDAYFWLDAFRIAPNPAPEPEPEPTPDESPAQTGGGGGGSSSGGGSSGGGDSDGSSGSGSGSSSSAGVSESGAGTNGDNSSASQVHTSTAAGEVSVYVTMGGGSSAAPETSGSAGSFVSEGNDSKTPIGPIIGGVLGGLCMILIFVGFVLWMKRKKKGQAPPTGPSMTEQAYSDIPRGAPLITPFNMTSTHSSPDTAQHSFNGYGSGSVSEKGQLLPTAATGAAFGQPDTGPSPPAQRAFLVPASEAGGSSTSEKSGYALNPNPGASMYASSPEPSAPLQGHHHQYSITSTEALSDRPSARTFDTAAAPAGTGTFHSIPSEAPPAYFRRSEVQPPA